MKGYSLKALAILHLIKHGNMIVKLVKNNFNIVHWYIIDTKSNVKIPVDTKSVEILIKEGDLVEIGNEPALEKNGSHVYCCYYAISIESARAPQV